jgi:hypothetical protein
MNTISKLFVPGRPLVRHYDFGEPGMVENKWIRLFVWDEGREGTTPEETRAKALATGDFKAPTSVSIRQAYAVDLDEMTWYCLLLGVMRMKTTLLKKRPILNTRGGSCRRAQIQSQHTLYPDRHLVKQLFQRVVAIRSK